MKKYLLVFALCIFFSQNYAQETITLSGGYVTARAIDYSSFYPVDYRTKGTGFRISGLWEAGPIVPGKFVHGLGFAYIRTNSTITESGLTADINVRTLPLYYSPKFTFGSEKAMGFVKASVGMQFARFKAKGDIEDSDHDWGFYSGLGFGGMVYLKERMFLNLEYEMNFITNTYYANGILNTVQMGIGFDIN